MSSPVGQFVLGFAIAFAPAPVVGFATWSMVNSDAPAPAVQVEASPNYGSPLDREWSDTPGMHYDEDAVPEQPPMQEAEHHEMEIETNCAKRKKRKQIEKRPKPERETPDL